MATPPKLKSLRPEDYDFNGEASEWGPKLLQVLTQFCGDVTSALSGQLTTPENIKAEERDIDFNTGAAVAIDSSPFPLIISPQLVKFPKTVTVTNPCRSGGTVPLAAAQPVFRLTSDGGVELRLVTGLDVNSSYKMRFKLE